MELTNFKGEWPSISKLIQANYNDFSHARDGKLYCITLVKETYGLNLLNPSSIWKRAIVIDDPMTGYIKPTYDENGNVIVKPVNQNTK